ncbi:hypothetical protein ACIQ9Q_31045 [Streptomyces sp. NPDC094438]|uniref:hypothetical protein n=1 Tax=Streptomyces sp. NPDC094438 TaxID=3366061 RepID=UPI0038046326
MHVTARTPDDRVVDWPDCGAAAHRVHGRYQRHEHVVDPEHRPAGLTEQDVPELLGALLGLIETEAATLADYRVRDFVGTGYCRNARIRVQ